MRPVGSKYLLEETLGRGATGTVWRGQVRADVQVPGTAPGQQVAIKILREELAADPDVVMRFLRERSVLLRLTHPNIVKVRDLVVEGELLALVMDLVDGPDLARYLRDNGPFSPIAGALLMAQVADALAASHVDGIVHRDLKPANVLLATAVVEGTEQMHPMLTDFGIARLADSPGITRSHEFVGTPAYVAPESAEGRPQTSAVDVYGAGIMLYELVTGRQPFQGDNPLAILQAHLAQEPQRPSTMPEPLWTVIERCLRKDPAQRPSAVALAGALRVVAAGVGVHASPAAVDAALAVGALLAPDPQPTAVPGTGTAAGQGPLGGAGAGTPFGTEDRTQVLPAGQGAPGQPGQPGQYDPAAATRVMGTQPPPYDPAAATRVMPPAAAPPPPSGPPQAEAPHPWQTQLRAARDRNQQTEIGYFGPEDFEAPPVAPPPYQAGPGGHQQPGHPQYGQQQGHPQYGRQGGPGQQQGHPQPQGYQQGYPQPGQQPPGGHRQAPPGYAQRPPVAPPPYQVGPGGQPQGGHPQPPGGHQRPPQGGHRSAPPQPDPRQAAPAAPPRRSEPPAPQHREPAQRRAEPPREAPREAPRREPRQRSRNRMYIPGLGCLKGCLMVLLVLAVAAVALWNFTPLPEYWAHVQDWFTSAKDWVTSVFDSTR